MKIGIDARFLLRKQRGMPVYVTQLCMQLPRLMPEYKFVLYVNSAFEHNDDPSEYLVQLNTIRSFHNVSIVDLPHLGEMHWEWWILPQELKKSPVDVLHMPGNRALLRSKIPQVVTFHDMMEWESRYRLIGYKRSDSLGTNVRSVLRRIHVAMNYGIGIRLASHVLTISKISQYEIVRYFPSVRHRSSYVYHGLPPVFECISELVPMQERKGVLMLGGDSDQKNCENAILAWYALPSRVKCAHPLTILGFVGDEDSMICKTIKRLGIEKDLTILGWVDESTIVNSFKSCRAFLYVSKIEGFGFPLIQAMACGTPVVISQAEALTELAADSMPTAPYNEPEKISEKLQKLIESDDFWLRVQVAGQERITEFNWDKVADHIQSLYQRVNDQSKGIR